MMWFGELPGRWDLKRAGTLFSENTTSNTDLLSDIPMQFRFGEIIQKRVTEKDDALLDSIRRYTVVQPNDIMVNGLNLNYDFVTQRVAIVRKEGCMTPAYISLRPKHLINPYFACYLLKAMDGQKILNGLGTGIRLTLGFSELKKTYLPLPPRDEQDQIVRYLDWKVSQINKLINAKRRQIALLQEQNLANINSAISLGLAPNISYRDTEIAWMDKIPAAWNTSAIKNHFCIEKRIAGKEGYDVLSITQKGLKVKDISTNEGQMAANYANYQFVYPGDFAMNHMDLLTGYIDISEHFGVTSPDYRVFVLTDSKNCWADYFLRVYQGCYKRRIFYGFGRGAASHGRWRLPKRNFLNFLIPLPPIDEQKMIAKFCNDSENRTLSIVSKYEKEISLLTEYRTRLISDVVTGKLDVRGVTVPEYEAVDVGNDIEEDEEITETGE